MNEQHIGELWRVKVPGSHKVFDMKIVEITPNTVLLSFIDYFGMEGKQARYMMNEVDFIERFENDANSN